jgi:uncharacterized LabA/DUF88 family protein
VEIDSGVGKSAVLVIDGENFIRKVYDMIRDAGQEVEEYDIARVDLSTMLSQPLAGFNIQCRNFYSARVHENLATRDKSKKLIQRQRSLKANLEHQRFNFLICGNVRSYPDFDPLKKTLGRRKPIFKEKGVDVGIAVDLVSWAYEKRYDTVILGTSDSDMQPVVKKCKEKGMRVVYLGFELMPNKGLTYTCDKTILLRGHEVLSTCPKVHIVEPVPILPLL